VARPTPADFIGAVLRVWETGQTTIAQERLPSVSAERQNKCQANGTVCNTQALAIFKFFEGL